MFIFISELLIFVSIIWAVTYGFDSSKKITNIDNIDINKVVTQLNWAPYEKIYYNTKTNKAHSSIYKEIILEFATGTLNPNLCNLLNKK